MSPSNLQLLTNSHSIVASKKRAKAARVKEIVWDDAARCEFLTGFHKRKLAKADAARKKATEREKSERLNERRERRRQLRERAQVNADLVEKTYGAIGSEEEVNEAEWSGASGHHSHREDEYEDEEVLATVTVVDEFDPQAELYGGLSASSPQIAQKAPSQFVKLSDKILSSTPVKKPSKQKHIRYKAKPARKAEKQKQFGRRREKAELAGGKASRKSNFNRTHKKRLDTKR